MQGFVADPPCSESRLHLVQLGTEDLAQVLAIEAASYSHPWTKGNFEDSVAAGYWFVGILQDPSTPSNAVLHPQLLAYMVVMQGADEAHLLNITVSPPSRGQGLARFLLGQLVDWSVLQQLQWVWLEVRASNTRAQQVYRDFGFAQVGRRPNYYPASVSMECPGGREDAIIMSLRVGAHD